MGKSLVCLETNIDREVAEFSYDAHQEQASKPKQHDSNEFVTPATEDLASLAGALKGVDILFKAEPHKPINLEKERHPSLCMGKHAFDFFAALVALILLAPVLLASALAVWMNSRGPIFFRQTRVGRGGSSFSIFKFRTMAPDADRLLAEYLERDPVAREEWDKSKKLKRDPRVTTVGRILRKYSIDEFPQFLNVLKGDMSIVGPRPIQHYEIPLYSDAFAEYCAVRPGLTGLWQVSGRSDTTYGARVALDRTYVQNWSAEIDLQILLQTLPAVVKAAGAY